MSHFVSGKILAGAAAFGLGLAAAFPGQAFDAVEFTVSGGDKSLTKSLRAASGLVGAAKDKSALDLFADARAEYGRLLAALYATGHYGPVIHVLVDGREAAGIAPLDAPTSISHIAVTVDPGPVFTFSVAQVAPLANSNALPPAFAAGKLAASGGRQGGGSGRN